MYQTEPLIQFHLTYVYVHVNEESCHTLLVVQQEVAVLVASGDGVRNYISIGVIGMDNCNKCIWTGVLTEEGLITVGDKTMISTPVDQTERKGMKDVALKQTQEK